MSGPATGPEDSSSPVLSDYLETERINLELDTTSRKRLFEHIARLSCEGLGEVTESGIHRTLAEREKLGSTGLGKGIAVPHGRIKHLNRPVISVVRLRKPIDYDAPDGLPVWLVVGLLVPEEANSTHLKLFSLLVKRFQDEQFVESMKRCKSRTQVPELFRMPDE